MSTNSNILKSFLVKIGFDVDDQQYRTFQDRLQKATKNASEMGRTLLKVGEASLLAMTGITAAAAKIARPMEAMYFSAKRVGASAKDLDEFRYAAERVGVSADQATGSIEALAQARRTNPGLNGILASFGINPRDTNNVRVMLELLTKLRAMPHFQAAQIAGLFGIDEQTLQQLEQNGPEFAAAFAQRAQMLNGIDLNGKVKQAHEFMNRLRELGARARDLGITIGSFLMPYAEKFMWFLEKFASLLIKVDGLTHGWSTRLIALGIILKTILVAFKGLSGISSLLGIAARGGAVAAGGGAAATAEGGLGVAGGLVSMPVLIAAAVAAALVWMGTHPEQVRAAVSKAWGFAKEETGNAVTAVKELATDVKKSGGWFNALKLQPGVLGDLMRFTGKFEGFRDKVYNDIAGNATAFFGHKLKKGEDVSQQNPISLFAADLRDASAAVHRWVRVSLNGNQEKALDDLVYNIGEQNFRKSSLLRLLNAGNFDEAAQHFSDWSKITKDGHKVANAGLAARRAAEAQLFRTPDGAKFNLQQTNNYHIDSTDPREAAAQADRRQRRSNADLVRNFATAVQ